MIREVNAFGLKQFDDFLLIGFRLVDFIIGNTGMMNDSTHTEIAIWHDFKIVFILFYWEKLMKFLKEKILTLSMISQKWTSTLAFLLLWCALELWISSYNLLSLIQLALFPKTNNRLSMRFDLPEPLGPTTEVNL